MQDTWKVWMGVQIALIEDDETQRSLASRAGIEPSRLSRIIRGKAKPSFDEVVALARAQDRPLAWYMTGPSQADSINPGYLKDLFESSVSPDQLSIFAAA